MKRSLPGAMLAAVALLANTPLATRAASIRREILVEARPELVWAAVRDFGAVHKRLVPGFVVDAHVEADARIVTFANGTVVRELLVDLDDKSRRLVYAVVGGGVRTHSASVQVFADREGRSRIVWVTDVLPNELAGYVSAQMDEAARVMKRTLEHSAAP